MSPLLETRAQPAPAHRRRAVGPALGLHRAARPGAASVSSPIAAAAARPASMSPGSSQSRSRLARLPQTPARQSACSSMRTDSALASSREPCRCAAETLLRQAEQVLHVVADLVRDHVGAREVARRAEALLELLEERRGRGTPANRSGSRRVQPPIEPCRTPTAPRPRTTPGEVARSGAPFSAKTSPQTSSVEPSTTAAKRPRLVASARPSGPAAPRSDPRRRPRRPARSRAPGADRRR